MKICLTWVHVLFVTNKTTCLLVVFYSDRTGTMLSLTVSKDMDYFTSLLG